MLIESLLIILALVIFVSLVMVGWTISTYNSFVALRQDTQTQFSNIKTEYQRRVDLFYNLVSTVKSFKKHEKSTMIDVVKARSEGFTGIKSQDMKKMGGFDAMFSKLLAVFERYPDLKSNEQHNKLMDEVRITEDRINVARTDYNSVVRSYNVMIKSFPSNLIAGMFNFVLDIYFKNKEGTDEAPKIELE